LELGRGLAEVVDVGDVQQLRCRRLPFGGLLMQWDSR
jgi:hypothetical protein